MKYHWTGICFFVLAFGVWRLNAQDPPSTVQAPAASAESEVEEDSDKKSGSLMRQKLKYTQRMLEGLATEDFDMIRKNAKLMNAFTQLESRFWADTEEYRSQLQTFKFTNKQMMRMAEAKNLDGVALAYTQMTMTCFNCHVLVRENGGEGKSQE